MTTTDPLEQTAHAIEERVRPHVEHATRKLTTFNAQATTYIKAHPGRCLLGAVAAGYIIGRIARRK
jgi:predicted ATP-grasp superfamily ATP-dependent carboligase